MFDPSVGAFKGPTAKIKICSDGLHVKGCPMMYHSTKIGVMGPYLYNRFIPKISCFISSLYRELQKSLNLPLSLHQPALVVSSYDGWHCVSLSC